MMSGLLSGLLSGRTTRFAHAAAFSALVSLFGPACAPAARADDIVLAAAASMIDPIAELIERFERETGHTVRLSLGSSGSFVAQISNGAPFDVFLAADMNYPRRLEQAGLIEPGSLQVYGTGRIVLWVRQDSPVDLGRLGMEALLDPAVRRIAIANPRLAPYGTAAVEAMEGAGIYDQVSPRIVRGENVAQAAQFVAAGAADIGVIALSQAAAPRMPAGRYWEVPADLHAPIEQGVAILARARQSGRYQAARQFVDMLMGPLGRSILGKYGFAVP